MSKFLKLLNLPKCEAKRSRILDFAPPFEKGPVFFYHNAVHKSVDSRFCNDNLNTIAEGESTSDLCTKLSKKNH